MNPPTTTAEAEADTRTGSNSSWKKQKKNKRKNKNKRRKTIDNPSTTTTTTTNSSSSSNPSTIAIPTTEERSYSSSQKDVIVASDNKKDEPSSKASSFSSSKKRKRSSLDDTDNNPKNNNHNKNNNNKRKVMTHHHHHHHQQQQQRHHHRPKYSFQVDDTDHCETPLNAYKDLVDILDKICDSLGKNRSSLIIYDPYYCDGSVKRKLFSLGYTNVINENRDFYQDIKDGTIPNYDILITNPPYSGIHIEKLLKFALSSSSSSSIGGGGKEEGRKGNSKKKKNNSTIKPWLFLLPHFVYTKDYYTRALSTSTTSSTTTIQEKIYFLVPKDRYSYVPPIWVQKETGSTALAKGKTKTAPFPSFWYCYTGSSSNGSSNGGSNGDQIHHQSSPELVPTQWLVNKFGPSGGGSFSFSSNNNKLRYANCTRDIPRDFKGEFDPTKKRPNPKARKRAAAKKRRQAAEAAGGFR